MKQTRYAIVGLLILSFVLTNCRPLAKGGGAPESVEAATRAETSEPTALAEASREPEITLTPSSGSRAEATGEPEVTIIPPAGAPPEATAEPEIQLTPASIGQADAAMSLGDPLAPVTIVEFSDYQCPFCASHAQQTWPQLKAAFVDTGRVRYVFKDLPITNIHPNALKAHEAARCAGEQGAYWEMHGRLFGGQSVWGNSLDYLAVFKSFAAELALATSAFDACLDSGRWSGAVEADSVEGMNLGARGTPTFFINGYPLVGAQPFETFEYAIGLAEQGELGDAYRPQSSAPPPDDTSLAMASISDLSPEIQQLSVEVQAAYRFAVANPDVLDRIPCYCGCTGEGHLSNRMCYVQSENGEGQVVYDDHAAG